MYVRKLNLVKSTKIDQSFDDILIKNNIYEKKIYNDIPLCSVDIYKSYEIMLKDIRTQRQYIYPEMI
jgi:hypothetical protein